MIGILVYVILYVIRLNELKRLVLEILDMNENLKELIGNVSLYLSKF